MTFRPTDPNRPRRIMTEAQRAANDRNFRIFRIRGLHTLAFILSADRRQAVQTIIDDELRALGVEGQTARVEAGRARWERISEREAAHAELVKDLPF